MTQTRAPDTAEKILTALTDGFDGLSPQLQRAARYLIDHPRQIGVQSMRALATRAEVHPNTLVRLARQIGFEGYDELRARFRDFLAAEGLGGFRDRADWLRSLAEAGGTDGVIAAMARTTADNLDDMWQRQSGETLERVADLIIAAPRVYVLGMGSAYSMAHQFWYVARMGFEHIQPIPRHGSQPIDDIAWIGPRDVLVALTFQPYRAETMTAVRAARAAGARVVGITDSLSSPLARLSDHPLVTPTHTPQFFQSHSAATALLEGLLAVMVARAGDDVAKRIGHFHRARLAAGLYEEPAPLAGLG